MSTKRKPRPRREKHIDYDRNVFINCPFDDKFKPLYRAIIFSIHACGFIARSAQEGSKQNIRFTRILDLIGDCRYGIHDLSRIDLKVMPRNNMPLELGVFIGCRHFGTAYDYEKDYLVLDSVPHRYKQHITDLGGEDPSIHYNKPQEVVRCVRDWLIYYAPLDEQPLISSHSIMFEQLTRFYEEAPDICKSKGLVFKDLLFDEITTLITDWISSERHKLTEFEELTGLAL
ncbi:MAG: hypothetical protein H7319_15885 [Spirosoma sp.]|nr:hypothetical protein [Spirosoma sp.]